MSPANHATLSTSSVTFSWTIGSGAADYFLYVGTSQGANNILGKDEGLTNSQVVNGLPNGTIWVRLWTRIGLTWWSNDYSYTIFTIGDDYPAAWKAMTNTLSEPEHGLLLSQLHGLRRMANEPGQGRHITIHLLV